MTRTLLHSALGGLVLLALALPAVAGLFTSRNHRDGSGAIVTEIRDFGAFDRIRSYG